MSTWKVSHSCCCIEDSRVISIIIVVVVVFVVVIVVVRSSSSSRLLSSDAKISGNYHFRFHSICFTVHLEYSVKTVAPVSSSL